MSLNHFTEQIFDDSIIDNKITAINAKDMKNHNDFLYPYNLTVFRTMPTLDNVHFSVGTDTDKYENSKFSVDFAGNIFLVSHLIDARAQSMYQMHNSVSVW